MSYSKLEKSVYSYHIRQLQDDIPGTTSGVMWRRDSLFLLCLSGNPHIPFSGGAKGILTSADMDTHTEGWHLPGQFTSQSLKISRRGNVFTLVPELGKEYVLIKTILSAQHVLSCICTEQR